MGMSMVSFQSLVSGYLLEIKQTSLQAFKSGTLARLVAKEQAGEVVTHSELDKSVNLRQSAIPIEERVRAARTAIEDFEKEGKNQSMSCGLDYSQVSACT